MPGGYDVEIVRDRYGASGVWCIDACDMADGIFATATACATAIEKILKPRCNRFDCCRVVAFKGYDGSTDCERTVAGSRFFHGRCDFAQIDDAEDGVGMLRRAIEGP